MSDELKPCPFCGAPAKWSVGLVGCKPCGVGVRNESAWNHRAAAPTVAAPTTEHIARAIWAIRRVDEDRCDMELEDMGADHSVWQEAQAVREFLAGPAVPKDPA